MADHVRLSRSYLSDLYSKEMGESLSETLTRIRIEEAKRMLRTGEMKVYEVADAVGFPDAKTFAKTFKRVVGCSPKEFDEATEQIDTFSNKGCLFFYYVKVYIYRSCIISDKDEVLTLNMHEDQVPMVQANRGYACIWERTGSGSCLAWS